MLLTKNFWSIRCVMISTTTPTVQLLDFANYFRVYSLIIIMNLRRRQVRFKKTTFEKNAILSDRENWERSLFLGRFRVPLMYTRCFRNIFYHPFMKVEEVFWEEIFFQGKNVSHFLANATPVIRRNESQKTFGANPWIVGTTFNSFDIFKTGRGCTCRSERIFKDYDRQWRTGFFLKNKKQMFFHSQSLSIWQ